MAKQAAPSKKTAKVAKAAVAGKKAKRSRSRKESFGIYIHKVLKQVHPGEFWWEKSCYGLGEIVIAHSYRFIHYTFTLIMYC